MLNSFALIKFRNEATIVTATQHLLRCLSDPALPVRSVSSSEIPNERRKDQVSLDGDDIFLLIKHSYPRLHILSYFYFIDFCSSHSTSTCLSIYLYLSTVWKEPYPFVLC